MNNEQNSNILGNLTPIPPTSANNPSTKNPIPGENLTPIQVPSTQNQPNTQTPLEPTLPIQPVPGIIENNIPTNVSSEINSSSPNTNTILTTDTNTTVPQTEPVTPTENFVEPILTSNNNSNPTQSLNVPNPSPFDIGLNSSSPSNLDIKNDGLISPTIPTSNGTMKSSSDFMPSANNAQTVPMNNFGDATPLTNTNIDNGTHDNATSKKKYLGYLILFSILIIGLIIVLFTIFMKK